MSLEEVIAGGHGDLYAYGVTPELAKTIAKAVRDWCLSPARIERGLRRQRWHTHGDCGTGRCEHTPEEVMREVIAEVLGGV